MSRMSISMTLRGRDVDIDLHVVPPDESVGILGYGFEDEVITDSDTGDSLDWELTEDEIQLVGERVYDRVMSELEL